MRKDEFIFFIWALMLLLPAAGNGQQNDASTRWVDSVFGKLSLDEKIGQLFIIRAHTDLGDEQIKSVKAQIKKYHVGGLCFFAEFSFAAASLPACRYAIPRL